MDLTFLSPIRRLSCVSTNDKLAEEREGQNHLSVPKKIPLQQECQQGDERLEC